MLLEVGCWFTHTFSLLQGDVVLAGFTHTFSLFLQLKGDEGTTQDLNHLLSGTLYNSQFSLVRTQ